MILFSEPNLMINIYEENFNIPANRLSFKTNETQISKFELNYSYGSTREYYLIFPLEIIKFKIKNSNVQFLNVFVTNNTMSFSVTIDCYDITSIIDNDFCNQLRLKLI